MTVITNPVNTNNQSFADYDLSKALLGNNYFDKNDYTDSGAGSTLLALLLLGKIAATGLVVPLGLSKGMKLPSPWTFLLGISSICLIASSYYVINEILDAPSDKHHPEKKHRPIPSGRVKIQIAYAEWLVLMVLLITELTIWLTLDVFRI